jgi:hypothetical protein
MTTTAPPGTLTLPCDICGQPVTGIDGYICVDKNAAHRCRAAIQEWKTRNPGPVISGTALLTYPDAAVWQIYHRACDPQRDSDNDYWFYVGRADTALDLLGWTAHLLGKTWLKDTDWSGFLYRVLRANGWRS